MKTNRRIDSRLADELERDGIAQLARSFDAAVERIAA
jgi:hypothetical protein